jgi:hypothetical protein
MLCGAGISACFNASSKRTTRKRAPGIQSAIDQLLGPDGVLTSYLQADVEYWAAHHTGRWRGNGWSLAHETGFIKAWMGARVPFLQEYVAAQCLREGSCTGMFFS